jgi:flagellin-specific chaperone FliS
MCETLKIFFVMKLTNILLIAAAFSFVAAHEVCAQTAVNTSATAAAKTTQAQTPSPMTQSQQIDFIKTATGEQMEAFVRKVGTDEAQEISKILHQMLEQTKDENLGKQLIKFYDIITNIRNQNIANRNQKIAQLQAQADFQKGIVAQADEKIKKAEEKIAEAEKNSNEAMKDFE